MLYINVNAISNVKINFNIFGKQLTDWTFTYGSATIEFFAQLRMYSNN